MTLYKDLGVAPDADAATIRKAYRRQAMRHHPDRGGKAEKMQTVQKAYDILSDGPRRLQYDRTGSVDEVKSARQRAEETLPATFMAALGKVHDADYDNPFDIVRAEVEQAKQQNGQGIRNASKAIENWRKVLKRLRRKAGHGNMIEPVILASIGQAEQQIELMKDSIELCDETLKLLDEYEYSVESRTSIHSFGFNSGGMPYFRS